jgi:peptidoglycan/LPS O-acetylase OafA/YrhL
VLPALVMLPVSWGRDFGSNGPLWSLGYEVVYYLLYLVWIRVRDRGVWIGYGLGLGISVAVTWFFPETWAGRVMSHYPVWLAGAALAEGLTVYAPGRRAALATLVVLAGVVGLGHATPGGPLLLVCYGLGGTAVVLLAAMLPMAWARQGWFRLWEWLGVSSYSIYICHFPVLTLMSAALIAHGGRPMSGWIGLGGALLALATALGAFQLVEKRFLHERLR